MGKIINIGFSDYSDAELIAIAQNIVNKMTGNKHFPTPSPTIESVATFLVAFLTALAASISGGPPQTIEKNNAREALEKQLHKLGLYVEQNGNYDPVILGTTGFEFRKEDESYLILAKPENVKLVQGPYEASLDLSCDPIKGASLYILQITQVPVTDASVWTTKIGKKKATFTNLQKGKEYAGRIAGKNTYEGEVYSDIITHYVA
jgi:hypothetical protein